MDFKTANEIESEGFFEEFDLNVFSGFSDEEKPPEIKITGKIDDYFSHCDPNQDLDIINVIYNPKRANTLLNKINKTIQKYLKLGNISLREVSIIKSTSKKRNDLEQEADYYHIDIEHDRKQNKKSPFKNEDESSSSAHSQQLLKCLGKNSRKKKKKKDKIPRKNMLNDNDQFPYKK